jgi:DNA-binding CsgD family transcriptional regulator
MSGTRPQAKVLEVLIREAARPEADQIRGRAMSLRRPSFRRPYAVLVSPLKRVFFPVGNPAAVVLVTDPERKLPPGTDYRLACQFGLTPAEGRIAAIACDKTVEEAAAEFSIGIATARAHVRKILLKTGSNRQTDLVRTLLTSPFLVNTG